MVTRSTRPTAQLRTCLERGFLMTELRTDRFLASVAMGSRRAGNVLNLCLGTLLVSWFCIVTATASRAQSVLFTTLASFDGTNGADPYLMTLVRGNDGNFYGTTDSGGANQGCSGGCGTVFKITPTGHLAALYSFCSQPNCTDGYSPESGLILGTDGNFYGTTSVGGEDFGTGTVFKITPSGTLTTLHTFQGDDGIIPVGALVQASDGNFYGTTGGGGIFGNCLLGCGTVFKMAPDGTLTTLHDFCSQPNCTDGAGPNGGLVQGTDGNLYGTTVNGGSRTSCSSLGCGTVFQITLEGTLTTLYSFCSQLYCTDGDLPEAGLIQATDGSFYGTTLGGGNTSGDCNFYFTYGCGTVFKITAGGKLTTLHAFDYSDGAAPNAALMQAIDGNFYGTAEAGGENCSGSPGCGTVFRITPVGALTTLHSFCSQANCADGSYPYGGLVQAPNRYLYGTTSEGGTSTNCSNGCGTVFSVLPVNECATCRP